MQKRSLGKTGLQVSALGFGGAGIGYENKNLAEVSSILNGALDAGLNVIDTAECYLTSEDLIGQAVSGRRREYFLFTKCGHSRGYEDPDWNDPKRLEESLSASLKRLRTDAVDLLQIHSASLEFLEQGTVIDFVQRAKQAGKTRFIGYSGDGDAALYAVRTGLFDTLQTSINIADQESIDGSVREAAAKQMGIIAKRPIANASWRHVSKPDWYFVPYWERLQKLKYDFAPVGKNDSISSETALRFTLTVPGVSTAIVGTTRPGRWEANACIVEQGPLDPDTYESIRKRWQETVRQFPHEDWIGKV